MKAVIMAGGKGTRIASVASDIPKPMIEIHGKPILAYEIECLKKQGLTDIVLIIGYLGEVIKAYFEDGSKFGVHISYIYEEVPLGTAGGLWFLKDKIEEDFLLLNGDIVFDVDFNRFLAYHKQKGCMATILTHPNSHPYDSGIIMTDEKQIVTEWLHKEDKRTIYKNRVNAGLHILSPEIFKLFGDVPEKKDLDRDILKSLIVDRKLAAYDSPEYVKDMGTPERYLRVAEDISSGLVEAKNLNQKQCAVFLDRDGTINVYKGFLRSVNEMELIDGVAEAIRRLNESRYLVIVVTNQPVIARGECSYDELNQIHAKMETMLGMEGAYIDGLFFCPHHPDKGFDGKVAELKFNCDCRKPKAGLFLKAAEKYHIDLSRSYMIGDDERDILAGINAGCKESYKIDEEHSLLDWVNMILSKEV